MAGDINSLNLLVFLSNEAWGEWFRPVPADPLIKRFLMPLSIISIKAVLMGVSILRVF